MNKGLKKILIMLALTIAMAFITVGCSGGYKNDAEKAQEVIEAYKTGSFRTFKSYLKDENCMKYMINALDDRNAKGMAEVYQKLYELTKTVEYTVKEELDPVADDGYVTVTIKTVDFTNALKEAMWESIDEGGEAFADVSEWMMKALNTGGEPVEKEIRMLVSAEDYPKIVNSSFLEILTGGFYHYMDATITKCEPAQEDSGKTYFFATDEVVSYAVYEFLFPFEVGDYTDEEINEVVEFLNMGFSSGDEIKFSVGDKVKDGVILNIMVGFDSAAPELFEFLGLLNLTTPGKDKTSLSELINVLEFIGYTCETTSIGSGANFQ